MAAAAGALTLLGAVGVDEAAAKGPGARYCFYGTCHKVKTIAETEALVGKEMRVSASFYDSCKSDRYNPCGLTSSGEVFRPDAADNAASPDLPDGTILLVRNPSNGHSAVIRVNNAGPYWGKRKLDLSRAAAEKLGFRHSGVSQLDIRVIKAPTEEEARYRKGRRYNPVPGYIGRFASADEAHVAVAAALALEVPQSIRVASLDGAAAVLRSEDADRHGLRAALQARIKDLPQQQVAVATEVASLPSVRATWREAQPAEPRHLDVVAEESRSETSVVPLDPPASGGLTAVAGETPVIVLASLKLDSLEAAQPAETVATLAVPEATTTTSEPSGLGAFALFVPDREPQPVLAAVTRQVEVWQPIEPPPSCVTGSERTVVAYIGTPSTPPARARITQTPELRA